VKTEREQTRTAIGFNGQFKVVDRDVHVDGYAQYSKLDGTTISYGVPNILRVQQATDAVTVNGQVVCRDVTARAAGCVPWDLVNGASREAVLWSNGVSATDQTVKQTVAGINFNTNVYDLPAGPIGVAFGAEYRKEESLFVQDALGASGALFFNAIGTRGGQYNVKEAYGEIRIPILKDQFLAKELSVELAGRVSDYSTIGNTSQYRLHAEWAPVEDVRFRATQSTAVRAPNIVELFAPQSRNFTTTAIDPCDKDVFRGATAAQQAARRVTCAAAIPGYNPLTFVSNFGAGRSSLALLQGGNPDLGPEKAHTYEYGVVVRPHWVPGLELSMDYFKYNLTDAVGTVPINTLFSSLCHDDTTQPYASNPFCAQIQRDPTGTNGGAVPGGVVQVLLVNPERRLDQGRGLRLLDLLRLPDRGPAAQGLRRDRAAPGCDLDVPVRQPGSPLPGLHPVREHHHQRDAGVEGTGVDPLDLRQVLLHLEHAVLRLDDRQPGATGGRARSLQDRRLLPPRHPGILQAERRHHVPRRRHQPVRQIPAGGA
jgi:hypothetical protein